MGVRCGEKQSDLSMVIMVFDFCSIRKHVEKKKKTTTTTFLDDVKVVVSKYLGLLDFAFYMFVEIFE